MIKSILRAIENGWNRFFFAPTSPATLGLFRICFGVVIFLAVLGRYPYRELFYSDNGIVSAATTAHHFPFDSWLFFRWVPNGDPWLQWYFWGILAATVSFTIGWQTRVSTVLVFLGLISLSNRNLYVDNAGDDLMRINCLFLMFAPAGAAYSIDRWWRMRRGKEGRALTPRSPWAQRLMQLQLAYLYADTFILKIPGEGWRDGTALYYALNYLELRRFNFKYLFYYLWQIKLATYGVMVGEFLLAFMVWFRRFRYPILAFGVALHLGINLTMQFPIFQYVMITSLINFIYPEDTERFMAWLGQRWINIKNWPRS